jgi:hypothetical protein
MGILVPLVISNDRCVPRVPEVFGCPSIDRDRILARGLNKYLSTTVHDDNLIPIADLPFVLGGTLALVPLLALVGDPPSFTRPSISLF